MFGVRSILWGTLFTICGCATSAGPFITAAESDGGAAPSGVRIEVTGTSAPSEVRALLPQPGRRYVALAVALTNETESDVTAAFSSFALETSASLVLLPSAASAFVKTPCALDMRIGAGGSFACELVFEVPMDQHATRIRYDDRQGHGGSAELPTPVAPNACTVAECWRAAPRAEPDHCISCLATTCGAELFAFADACGSSCNCPFPTRTELLGGAENECSCFASCATDRPCAAAIAAWGECARGCSGVCDDSRCAAP
ncbi:MAG: hypothetical protein JSS88_09455 [Actinobacteria bacterium]|nr:hypothetical protein [Actinomycetota bacterium]